MRTYATLERFTFRSLALRKSLEDHPYRIIRHGRPFGLWAAADAQMRPAHLAGSDVRATIRVADRRAEMEVEVGHHLNLLA